MTEAASHATAEEGVAVKDIAEVIGRRLGVPVESKAPDHFGWFGAVASVDAPASSSRTRALPDWRPTGPDLLADIDQPGYSED